MTFATPAWLWALVALLPLAIWRVWAALEGRDAVARLVSAKLRPQLLAGGSAWRARFGIARFALGCTAYAALVFALARPQWGEVTRQVSGEGRSVMFAIDTSRSMLADDLKPDRLTRAKFAALDLIDALPADQIGLIAFSGTADVQVPLTTDRAALEEGIDQLDTYAVARGGTNLAAAIELAARSAKGAGTKGRALVLFTDGEAMEGESLDAAATAAKEGLVVVAIGVGSREGASIRDPESRKAGGDFIRNDRGEVVRSRLDMAGLEKIAKATDGLSLHLNSDAMNAELVNQALSELDKAEFEGGEETVAVERFAWPLGAALLLLALAGLTRLLARGAARSSPAAAITALLLLSLSHPGSAGAGAIVDAERLFDEGEFAEAAELYRRVLTAAAPRGEKRAHLQLALGSAEYESGAFGRALDAFADALLSTAPTTQADAHYNLGNTLFRSGEAQLPQPPETPGPTADTEDPAPELSPSAGESILRDWLDAAAHYEAALQLEPENQDAAHNLEVVRKRIEQLQPPDEEQQPEEQQQNPDQGQQDEDEEQDQQEGGEEEERPQEQEPPEGQEQAEPQESDPQQGEDAEGDDSQDSREGEQNEAPTDGGSEGEEGSEQADQQQPQPGEQGEERPGDEGEPSETAPESPGGDPAHTVNEPGDADLPEDQVVDPRTGYSKEQALRQLDAYADEHAELKPLRRRVRGRSYKDW